MRNLGYNQLIKYISNINKFFIFCVLAGIDRIPEVKYPSAAPPPHTSKIRVKYRTYKADRAIARGSLRFSTLCQILCKMSICDHVHDIVVQTHIELNINESKVS